MKNRNRIIAFGFVLAALASCDDTQAIPTCNEIPDGGCPLTGDECQDPTCAAAYTCNDGTWTFVHACAPIDAGTLDVVTEVAPISDAGYDIDAPPGAFGGPGCDSLEPPDCPLGVALLCNVGCCSCEDLYVCDDGGWDPWGTCSDDAGISSL